MKEVMIGYIRSSDIGNKRIGLLNLGADEAIIG
jgi:hypothetical protein